MYLLFNIFDLLKSFLKSKIFDFNEILLLCHSTQIISSINTGEPDCHYIHRLTHVSMVIAYECMVIHLISWSIPLFSWLVKTKNVGF